jgi:hypothetical protein
MDSMHVDIDLVLFLELGSNIGEEVRALEVVLEFHGALEVDINVDVGTDLPTTHEEGSSSPSPGPEDRVVLGLEVVLEFHGALEVQLVALGHHAKQCVDCLGNLILRAGLYHRELLARMTEIDELEKKWNCKIEFPSTELASDVVTISGPEYQVPQAVDALLGMVFSSSSISVIRANSSRWYRRLMTTRSATYSASYKTC